MAPRRTTKSVRPAPRAITMEYVEALKAYSELLFKGGLGPKGKNVTPRPETLAAIIEVGRDVGLPATMALSWITIINGKPSIWGDAGMGLIRASGLLAEGYPREKFEGVEGEDDYTAVFAIKRADGSPERITTFSVADAKRANLYGSKSGPWAEYPWRQLMWRARSWGCRDEFQDVLCGLTFYEEATDTNRPVTVVTAAGFAEQQGDDSLPKLSEMCGTINDNESQSEKKPAESIVEGKPAESIEGEKPPLDDARVDRLIELRRLVMASRSITDPAEQRIAWSQILDPFKSVHDMPLDKVDALIETLGKQHDPFTHPPESQAATSAA